MPYDPSEQEILLEQFYYLLQAVTADGGRKRARAEKPPWWQDDSHMAAIFSHLNRYFHGEKFDRDSGAHAFTHLAWRALAIAYQETKGKVAPSE